MAAHRDRYKLSREERRAFDEIARHLEDLNAPAPAAASAGSPAEQEPRRPASWWRRRRHRRAGRPGPDPSGEDG